MSSRKQFVLLHVPECLALKNKDEACFVKISITQSLKCEFICVVAKLTVIHNLENPKLARLGGVHLVAS
jgi:hypothetical protein